MNAAQENQTDHSSIIKYECRPLSIWVMIGQAAFFIPKFWRLQSFTLSSGFLILENGRGKVFSGPLSELSVTYSLDKFGRRFVTITRGKEKFRYQEIVGQLEAHEWNDICQRLGGQMSAFGRINHILTGEDAKQWALEKSKGIYKRVIAPKISRK